MTDAELIAQLRRSKGWPTLGHAAADRIEALAALHQAAVQDALAPEAYADELEAKLAKAVKFLEFLDANYRHVFGDTARAKFAQLYAELKGNTDD